MTTYKFHEDPAHGWLEVPMAELRELGIAAQISGYSYRKGESAFLEEDCDFAHFERAKAARGEEFDTVRVYWRGDAPMRNYQRFTA